MELLPDNNDKNPTNEKDGCVSKLMEKLENVQDMLGIIHDYDTMIAYLTRRKGTGTRLTLIHSILSNLNRERQNKYEEFVKFVNRDFSANNNNFFVRTTKIVA